MPSARLRSRPSRNVVVRIDSAAGESNAAPRPCRARKAISEPSDQAKPSSSELTVNSAEAGHEQAPPPEQVGHPAAEEEHAPEEDRVGGDHPLQALLREVQVGPDRRQRDVHDRDVEDDHELRGDDHRQREPAPAVVAPAPLRIAASFVALQSLSCVHDSINNDGRATLIPMDMPLATSPSGAGVPQRAAREHGFLLARLGFASRRRRSTEFDGAGFGPTTTACSRSSTRARARRRRRSPTRSGSTASQLVGLLDALEERGLIERQPRPARPPPPRRSA